MQYHESQDEPVVSGYFRKMKGVTKSPPMVSPAEIVWSWIGAFLGIAAVAGIHYHLLGETALIMVIGSFGASAVLIYGSLKSPFAQPRNLIGGHVISAVIGVACYQIFTPFMLLAAAVAVATAIAAMHATKTLHPPGGATALIAVIGGDQITQLGYLYAVIPVGSGALIMLLIALIVNNIPRTRSYPKFWV
ncbi:MAG: HPP family protein [Proteobacteria bacterium]|nr:HPP family protein [Pseudomonadota bacterium]MBU1641625.1 HPP family protein [Pseudomonadota bacterium]